MNREEPAEFRGRTVLVTGAAGGIGRALVNAFAAAGADVALMTRYSSEASGIASELADSYGVRTFGGNCDIRDFRCVEKSVAKTFSHMGRLDIVINNAATLGEMYSIGDCEPDAWSETIDTNLNGSFYVANSVLAHMREQGSGRIAFVSSTVGREARAGWGAYCVSKWAVEGLMQLIAEENRESDIGVCTINPGGTATKMRRQAFPEEDQTKLPSPEKVAQAFLRILAQPDERFSGRAFDARDFF